jgi:hypothetical protein
MRPVDSRAASLVADLDAGRPVVVYAWELPDGDRPRPTIGMVRVDPDGSLRGFGPGGTCATR